MNTIDYLVLFISAAAHDIDHPGNNNQWEINAKSKLSILYNDLSVLENHHAASLFFILEDDNCNIFNGFDEK